MKNRASSTNRTPRPTPLTAPPILRAFAFIACSGLAAFSALMSSVLFI